MTTRPDGSLYYVTGKSRSGKSAWTKEMLNSFKRQVVFDIKHEYSPGMGYKQIHSLQELKAELSGNYGPGKYAFQPRKPALEFGAWSKMAMTWCKMAICAVVAEELSDVTSPGKAPDGWGQVCRQGLGFGMEVFAITQRPSESDKTSIGNATLIHCCQMIRHEDQKYMSREMGTTIENIALLNSPFDENRQPQKGPHYLEKDTRGNQLTRGTLQF